MASMLKTSSPQNSEFFAELDAMCGTHVGVLMASLNEDLARSLAKLNAKYPPEG